MKMTLEVGTVVTATKSFSSVMVKADRKEFVKIGRATGKFMDSVSVGQFVDGSVTVDTPNIKVKRELIDLDKNVDSLGSDGSGLAIDRNALKNFGS